MTKMNRRSTRLGFAARAAVVAVACVGLVGIVVAVAASSPQPKLGDMNADGKVDFGDVVPFAHGLRDPAGFCQKHNCTMAELLALVDFSGNGQADPDDIPAFAQLVGDSLYLPPRGAALDGGRTTTPPMTDLDIDSDNSSSYPDALPARTQAEDTIEDDPQLPGKKIVNANTARAVLDFDDEWTTSLAGRAWRLSFGDGVTVQVPAFYGHTAASVTPGQDQTYPYGSPYTFLGDMNLDGLLNAGDIDPFVTAMVNPATYAAQYNADAAIVGDINGDWAFNGGDNDPFSAYLAAGVKRPIPIRLEVTGQALSSYLAEPRLVGETDSDGDQSFDPATEQDAVRVTVWNDSTLPPPAEAGAAPQWGAGIQVSPYSSVNLQNGNVLTAISLFGVDPVGPAIGFTLFHNSSAAEAGTGYAAWGFDLGDGWSVSYGSHVVGEFGDGTVTVVAADGGRDTYTRQGASPNYTYVAPPGVHSLLEWDGTAGNNYGQWTLTTPDLTELVYDVATLGMGHLVTVIDSSGNEVAIERDSQNSDRIDYIASAAHDPQDVGAHGIDLTFSSGRLASVSDPVGRTWTFEYTTSGGRLWRINFPTENGFGGGYMQFTYDTGGRVRIVRAQDGLDWVYEYDDTNGEVTIKDPPDASAVRYTQIVDYAAAPVDGTWESVLTDRRNYDWTYSFDTRGNLVELVDPESHASSWTHDADHNVLTATDPLNNTWTYEYGPVGNVTKVTSPLTGTTQEWTVTWEHPSGTPENFYRVTQYTDPASNWVKYRYAYEAQDPYTPETLTDPTLVRRVIEPATNDHGESATVLYYYGDTSLHARGQLQFVVDANDVHHRYEYDARGFFQEWEEGYPETSRSLPPGTVTGPTSEYMQNDDNGRPSRVTVGMCVKLIDQAPGGASSCGGWACANRGTGPEVTRLGNVPQDMPEFTLSACSGSLTYDSVGRVETVAGCFNGAEAGYRDFDPGYDVLKRMNSLTISTGGKIPGQTETWEVNRTTLVTDFDKEGRPLAISRPDGQSVIYRYNGSIGYDPLGRPSEVDRAGTMSATYVYDAAGRVDYIDYGNGTKVDYDYDEVGRLSYVDHRYGLSSLLRVDYVWNLDNTLYSRTEVDSVALTSAVVTFAYDARGRLISETRVEGGSTTVYDIDYTYDQLGNRLMMEDTAAGTRTCYVYDLDWDMDNDQWVSGLPWTPSATIAEAHETWNNRLLFYAEQASDGQGGWTTTREVRYLYYKETGHVSNIIVKDAGDDVYRDLALYYNDRGQLWRVLWDHWQDDGAGGFTGYKRNDACEFYYDGLFSRWLRLDLDPNFAHEVEDGVKEMGHWTDTNGLLPYGDFHLTASDSSGTWTTQLDEQTAYLASLGLHAEKDDSSGSISYLHGDLIESTMLTTDGGGNAVATMAYTAFGEPVGTPVGLRYRYAGGYGYESGLLTLEGATGTAPITLQHVGARWYQPAIGRFVQRDPIGIFGGFNLYAYCAGNPTASIDPLGLEFVTTGGSWWDRFIINATGGTTGSNGWSDFWDDRSPVNATNTADFSFGFGVGIGVCVVNPLAGLGLNWGAAGWRWTGGTTGNRSIDNAINGAKWGARTGGTLRMLDWIRRRLVSPPSGEIDFLPGTGGRGIFRPYR